MSGQDSIGLLNQENLTKIRKNNFWSTEGQSQLIPLSATYSDANRTFYGLSRKEKKSYLHIMKADGDAGAEISDFSKIYKSGKLLNLNPQ